MLQSGIPITGRSQTNLSQNDFLTMKDVLCAMIDSYLLELVLIRISKVTRLTFLKSGKRHCIGESLARDELFLIFTRLIQANSFHFFAFLLHLTAHLISALHLLCLSWNGSTITRPSCRLHSCTKVKPNISSHTIHLITLHKQKFSKVDPKMR